MSSPEPSKRAYVPFVSVANMMALINHIGIAKMLMGVASYIEEDFRRWELFDKVPRVASHSEVGVIELMPTSDGQVYGFKYVNGHPANTKAGLQTVTAFGMLAEVQTGYPVLLSEMTLLTALRTAATSALTGPSTRSQISAMTSSMGRPDLAISVGLVVTPSTRPVATSSLSRPTSVVSRKSCMGDLLVRIMPRSLPVARPPSQPIWAGQ